MSLIIRLFEILKMFYPPEGLCGAEPEGGPIVFTLDFIGVGKGTEGFKFWAGNPPFWNVENVIPRRDSAEQSPKVVQLFLLSILLV